MCSKHATSCFKQSHPGPYCARTHALSELSTCFAHTSVTEKERKRKKAYAISCHKRSLCPQSDRLWTILYVVAGLLPIQHEVVRVAPLSSRGFSRVGPDDVGAFSSPRAACTQPSGSVDVQVNLEYLQGCHRAHAAWLTLPVTPPFRFGKCPMP